MTTGQIYVCKESAVFQYDGDQVLVRKGETRVREGHPILKAHPELFEPLKVHYEVTEDTSSRTRDTGRTDAKTDDAPKTPPAKTAAAKTTAAKK